VCGASTFRDGDRRGRLQRWRRRSRQAIAIRPAAKELRDVAVLGVLGHEIRFQRALVGHVEEGLDPPVAL
jgi:hypothetical protein